jgi:hypothetical protein
MAGTFNLTVTNSEANAFVFAVTYGALARRDLQDLREQMELLANSGTDVPRFPRKTRTPGRSSWQRAG